MSDIIADGGTCTDGGAAFNGDRRDELAVGADKHVIADDSFEFIGTVSLYQFPRRPRKLSGSLWNLYRFVLF